MESIGLFEGVKSDLAIEGMSPQGDIFSFDESTSPRGLPLAHGGCSTYDKFGDVENTSGDPFVSLSNSPPVNDGILDGRGLMAGDESVLNENIGIVDCNENTTDNLADNSYFSSHTEEINISTPECHETGNDLDPGTPVPENMINMQGGRLDMRLGVSAIPDIETNPFRAMTTNDHRQIDQFLGIGPSDAYSELPSPKRLQDKTDDPHDQFKDKNAVPSEQVIDARLDLQDGITRIASPPQIRGIHDALLTSKDEREWDMPGDGSTMLGPRVKSWLSEDGKVLDAFQAPAQPQPHSQQMQSQVLRVQQQRDTYQKASIHFDYEEANPDKSEDPSEAASNPGQNGVLRFPAERDYVDHPPVSTEPKKVLEEESLVDNGGGESMVCDILAEGYSTEQRNSIFWQLPVSNLSNDEETRRTSTCMDSKKIRSLYLKPVVKLMKNFETRFARLRKSSTEDKPRYYAIKRMRKDVQEFRLIAQKIRIVAAQLEVDKRRLDEAMEQEKREVERLHLALAEKGLPTRT